MKLNLSNTYDKERAKTRLKVLIDKGAKIELTEIKGKRTIRQNSYLHVCISLFAIEFGYTLDEAKTLLKRQCEFMKYSKNGQLFLKRTREMDTKELTEFIEWIRNYSSQQGLYLPTSEEYLLHRFEIDKEIEQNKNYL
jgi:hypothetical protein